MSHLCKLPLRIKRLDLLEVAAEKLGLEFRQGQETYKWFGRFVGDTKLPDGLSVEDLGKCEHALRVKGKPGAYEIGLVSAADGDGYELLYDFWAGGRGLEQAVGHRCSKLLQRYSAEVTVETLGDDWEIAEEQDGDKLRLRLSR